MKNLVNLLHHELALRLVSSTLPAVGIALSAAVGPLFSPAVSPISFTSCKSAPFLPGFAQRLSATFATSLLGASCAVLMALHKLPAIARALVFDELSVRPRADPRVVLRTLLHVLRVVCWSSAPLSSSARYAWTLSTARSGCSRSRRQPALVRSRWMRSWSLFYFGFRVDPAESVSHIGSRVLSLPQLSRCVWLRAFSTSRCRHVMLITLPQNIYAELILGKKTLAA